MTHMRRRDEYLLMTTAKRMTEYKDYKLIDEAYHRCTLCWYEKDDDGAWMLFEDGSTLYFTKD